MSRFVYWPGLAVFALAWLALPAVTLADDCSDWTLGEIASCPNYAFWKTLAFIAGALLSAGAWLGSRMSNNSRELTPEEREEVMRNYHPDPPDEPPLEKNAENVKHQSPAYDPGGTNMGGSTEG